MVTSDYKYEIRFLNFKMAERQKWVLIAKTEPISAPSLIFKVFNMVPSDYASEIRFFKFAFIDSM